MQHTSRSDGRWAELTLPEQMANIGSETYRDLAELASLNKYLDHFARIRKVS